MTDATGVLPLGEVAAATAAARVELVRVLSDATNHALLALADVVPSADAADVVHLVVVGQYSAGKSSLVQCLTGMQVAVGADVTTVTAKTYPWRGHLIVDTPGVQAGEDEHHDKVVDKELRAADAVIFVLTAEGFDDVTATYFHGLRRRLRRSSQLILVVNKSLTEDSDRQAVEGHLRDVVGELLDLIPVVWTDARSWLQSKDFPDPAARRAASGIQELADSVDDIVRNRGAHLRLATPLRELSSFARDALDTAAPAEDDSTLRHLDETLAAVEAQREQLRDAIDQAEQETQDYIAGRLVRLGPDIGDTDLADVAANAQREFEATLAKEAEGSTGVEQTLELHGQVLPAAGKLLEQVGSPVAPWSIIRVRLLEGLRTVSRTFEGAGARPGGIGHSTVTRIWHGLGGKFKPWGAVKASKTVAKVAKVLGPALTIGEGAYGFWQEHQEARVTQAQAERIRTWPGLAADLSAEIVQPWAADARADAEQRIDAQAAVVIRQQLAVRTRLATESKDVAALIQVEMGLLDLLAQLQ